MSSKEPSPDNRLHVAVTFNKPELIDSLIAEGADVNARMTNPDEAVELNQVTALYMAARFGRIECLKRLLAAGADVNAADAHGTTPLHVVAYNNDLKKLSDKVQLECIQLLLEAGADVHRRNELDDTPLHLATQGGNAEVVRTLLAAGADASSCDKEGYRPIHGAAFHGHMEIIRMLLDAGADINARENAGFTPLALATIYYGTAENLRELIQLGADVSTVTDEGTNLLHHAAASCGSRQDRSEKMQELLQHGLDVNAVSRNGNTPLISATLMTLTDGAPADCAEMLVQAGADIHTPVNNSTLLHLSAEGGNASLVTLFLKAGASPTEKDAQGRSPLDYAFIHCTAPRPVRQEVIGILLDAAPELKKELSAMKRRFCLNLVLLAFCVLFFVRMLWRLFT